MLIVTFIPIGRWLHSRIEDLIYSQDDNPYALVAIINQQLQTMSNPQLVLPLVLETMATKLYLPYLCLEFHHLNATQTYTFGRVSANTPLRSFSIAYLERPLGTLFVTHRANNRPFSESDQFILHDIARQLGVALYVAELTAVLQTAREQLIIAREAERRRIRNDLHDGLASALSSFQLQLSAIRRLLAANPAQAEQMITELSSDLRDATAVIRQLVYDLRPPLLDEFGLIEAIKQMHLPATSLQLTVVAPNPLPPLSAAVEVAIYRIVSEAVHNVIKHAQATTCTITLTFHLNTMLLTIADDGQGMAAAQLRGIGIQSMRDRATELGGTFTIQPISAGGTQLEVRLPIASNR